MHTNILSPADSEKLTDLIKDIHVAMVATVASDGAIRSRPMANPNHDFDGDLWFFTALNSGKAWEIQYHPQVNAAFSEPRDQRYVSLSGKGTLVRDAAKAQALWNPLLKGWFPGGPEDPNLGLLRIEVDHVEYWDAKSSRMQVLWSLAKAAVTGEPPKNRGDHRRLA